MKKLLSTLTLLPAIIGIAAGWNSHAQSTGLSREILDRMVVTMKEYGEYRMDFTASSEEMFADVSGMYVVSGDKYYIKIQRQEQFSDGKSRWEIYPAEKEVVIGEMDLNSRNILVNPTRAFEFAPEEFDSSYSGTEMVGRVECHTIVLKPKSGMYGVGEVTLHVSVAGDIPVAITYDFDGEKLAIKIDKFTGLPAADMKLFEFDASKYKGYEIIDFRQ